MNAYHIALGTSILVSILSSFFANWFLIKRAATLQLIDRPNYRSSHSIPTARAGGLGILSSFSVGIAVFFLLAQTNMLISIVVFLAWILAAVGLYDDIVSATPRFRFSIQLIVMGLLLCSIHYLSPAVWHNNPVIKYIFIFFVFFAGLWLMNLYNFMDGINGIAASEAIFVLLAATGILLYNKIDSVITPSMLILTGACIGFFVWNFPRAKIFMGDSGSVPLGFILIFYAAYTAVNQQLPPVLWLILLSVFWVDATFTLLTRVFTKQKWHSPHRSHFYQILSRRLNSHIKVVALMWVYNLFWLLPLGVLAVKLPSVRILCLILAVIPILIADVYFRAGRLND
ncbi:MAG: glycosyltransferase family 4 protein [Legionellales bacterium]|nr:glycosyltransferase family 4 protein [Legionellales bacterium]